MPNNVDHTNTFLSLKAFSCVFSTGFIDTYNYRLLYRLTLVNSKFYEDYQPLLSSIERRLRDELDRIELMLDFDRLKIQPLYRFRDTELQLTLNGLRELKCMIQPPSGIYEVIFLVGIVLSEDKCLSYMPKSMYTIYGGRDSIKKPLKDNWTELSNMVIRHG